MNVQIRPIRPEDNAAIEALTLLTLTEFGCIGPGYASSDPELQCMYETYQANQSAYWVIENTDTGQVLGGGGYSQLKGTTSEALICEFQKFYFDPSLRGLGYGRKLISLVMQAAKDAGYQTLYLETVPAMTSAIALYEKMGFSILSQHLGNTGHQKRCPIYMSYAYPVKQGHQTLPQVEILLYRVQENLQQAHDQAFRQLNEAWIKKYFQMEPEDTLSLNHPKREIIDKGGEILFAHALQGEFSGQIIGTCALIKKPDGVLELSKMAVREDTQGLKVGKRLMQAAIDYAKQQNAKAIILDTNSVLKPAITLYESFGFRHVPGGHSVTQGKYKRADVSMTLELSSTPAPATVTH